MSINGHVNYLDQPLWYVLYTIFIMTLGLIRSPYSLGSTRAYGYHCGIYTRLQTVNGKTKKTMAYMVCSSTHCCGARH